MSEIQVEDHGAVRLVRLHRPEVLNAVTPTMGRAYAETLREADRDADVRVVVVTGSGRGFCAGADVGMLAEGPAAIREFLPPPEDLPGLALRLRKPVVCAANGPVAGIGFAYLMGSDVRFAAADASIGTTFARLGLVAEYGLSWLLPRAIGTGAAMDLLLTGRTVTGEEAGRIGLVQYVSAPGEVLDDAMAYAAAIAATCSPSSLAAMKRQVYADLDRAADTALTDTLREMDASFEGADLAEAIAARREKRSPSFAPLPEA